MCDDQWGNEEARVACRHAGFGTNGTTITELFHQQVITSLSLSLSLSQVLLPTAAHISVKEQDQFLLMTLSAQEVRAYSLSVHTTQRTTAAILRTLA